jgi:hypothetical protein
VVSPPAASPPPSQPGAPQPDGSPAKPGTALVLRSEAAASRTPGTPGTPAEALAEFAKDLRDLRSNAGLGYPEMAELSHYTMKTLASAAGGVKLPTLPVTAAYVRACGSNVAEWEDRWHDVAALVEPAGDRPESEPERAHGAPAETAPAGPGNGEPGGRAGPGGAGGAGGPGGARDGEPGEDPRRRTPPPEAGPRTSPGPGSQRPPSRGPEQVYVITSAAPKRPYR